EALRRGDWREAHVMPDLGAYPVAAGPLSGAAPRPQSTAELALLSRMAGSSEGASELRKPLQALAESDSSLRSAIALGASAAPRLKTALEAPRDQIRSDIFVDRLLRPALVPAEVVTREIAELRAKAGKYGTPFEGRKSIVHLDALLWLAALADPSEREAIAASVLRFYADSSARVPAADRFESETPRPAGTQARPVIGAVFAPLLLQENTK